MMNIVIDSAKYRYISNLYILAIIVYIDENHMYIFFSDF